MYLSINKQLIKFQKKKLLGLSVSALTGKVLTTTLVYSDAKYSVPFVM
jgi:hypothetical protein